jgi:predicted RecB family nuclease
MSNRSPNWVSKTDLLRYLRCPYAFYLLDQNLVPFADTVNDLQMQLIANGVGFQAQIEASIPRRAIAQSELATIFATESIRLHNLPILENCELEIYGQPDAIDTAWGSLFPVEIKSHKEVQRSDELELAFYWMLLEPYRTRPASPHGHLFLRRNQVVEHVEVEIRPQRFDEVREFLRAIRDGRRNGVQPEICRCGVCSGVKREDNQNAVLDRKGLTLIWGIGRAYAQCLEGNGIKTYDELVAADSAVIVKAMRGRVSRAQVDIWKHHARSYTEKRPIVFGTPLIMGHQFLVLDLEYTPEGFIWLIGVGLVGINGLEFFALWADSSAQEADNLRRLIEIVATNPCLPVVTWNGTGADLPHLRKAIQRHCLGSVLDDVEARHLDTFIHATKSVRFPMPELGLKPVAGYFGLPRKSRINGGLEANLLYEMRRISPDEAKRDALKVDLIEYNREDVETLAGVSRRIAALHRDAETSTQSGVASAPIPAI